MLALAFGNYFNYKTTPIFIIVITILFAATFIFFPESPVFLVRMNKISVSYEKNIPLKVIANC